jgi:LytS/YehU family sensor histidine kinase
MQMTTADRDEMHYTRNASRWTIIFVAWCLFGIAQTIIASLMMGSWEAEYVWRSFVQFMPRVIFWAAVTPLIALWDRETRKRTNSVLIRTSMHLPLFIICALAQAVIRRTVITLVMPGGLMGIPFYVTFLYFADVEAVRYVASLILGRVLEAASELVKRERREAALKEEIARAQLHYLDLQLQPHFLFNALGSISELAHEAPAVATRMVEHLTSLLRYATQSGVGQEVTLRQELDALYPYLEIQRMRFPDWLSISERIEPEAADALVPRLLLQPLVENAIRHGLSHRKTGGRIEFRASVHDEHLVLSVYDNGVGLTEGKGGLGIGLANIRERLATLYQDAQSLELLSHEEGGVEVLLRLPLRRMPQNGEVPLIAREKVPVLAPVTATALAPTIDVTANDSIVIDDTPPSKPTNALSMIGGWVFGAILLTTLSLAYVYIRHPDSHEPALEIIRRHLIHAGLWIALTPVVIYLARRFPLESGKLRLTLPLHLFASAAISILHLAGSRLLVGGEQPPLFAGIFMDAIYWNMVAYGIIVGITQRASIEEWIRERDVAAALMRAELTTARLSSVMLELRPDFLLQTLATLRTLVGINPRLAESLLTSFADFLRMTLESLGKQQMPVSHELALLSNYARLHRAGAGHFPDIKVDAQSGLERLLVPTGLMRLLADRLLESRGPVEQVIVSLRKDDKTLTVRLKRANVNNSSNGGASGGLRDPFRRLARLTDSGAVIRFSEDSSSLEVDLPLNGVNAHAAEKTGPLALQYGIP